MRLVREMEAGGVRPDVIHVNVIGMEAMLGYALHRRYGCPYVIMEHWSGYLPENGMYGGVLHRLMARFAVRRSSCLMAVSPCLMEAMERCGLTHEDRRVVANVVDDFFYKPAGGGRGKEGCFRFVHVSCFENRSKNVAGIVGAAERLRRKRADFELVMVGYGPDYAATVERVRATGLERHVKFTGELTPDEVCGQLAESHAFVLFSNYETCAVVLEESMAAGCPIISTPVGIAPEAVDGRTGIVVPCRDEEALAGAMACMMERRGEFDEDYIRGKASEYTYRQVGKRLEEVYSDVIGRQK